MPRHNTVDALPLSVELEDGEAVYVGDGLFVVSQTDEETNRLSRTVLSLEDMRRMKAIISPSPQVDLGEVGLSARAIAACS